jgi:hypothetical protein
MKKNIILFYKKTERLEVNGTHGLLVYANHDNVLGEHINIIKTNTEHLLDASKEVGPEANTEKIKYACTKCTFMSRHQTAGQNHKIQVAN